MAFIRGREKNCPRNFSPTCSPRKKLLKKKQMDAGRVFHNLRIVSKLSQNDKLVTEGLTFGIRTPSMWRELVRTWHGETREHMLMSLQALMGEAINILALTRSADYQLPQSGILLNTCTSGRMLAAIQCAIPGLQSLLQTYSCDVSICARLHGIKADTEEFIRIFLQHSPELTSPPSSPQ